MKRTLAAIAAAAIALPAFPVQAAEAPADIDAAAYANLLSHSAWALDKNDDDIISEEELVHAEYVNLDLTDVKDISWLGRLKSCGQLSLKNGDLTDFSVLAQMPALFSLSMDSVPAADLSFMDSMLLERCDLTDMPQITDEMRAEHIRFSDLTLTAGTMDTLSFLPNGLAKVNLKISDGETARFLGEGTESSYNYQRIYGLKAGETTYTALLNDQVIAEKKITVKEAPEANNPPLQDSVLQDVSIQRSYYYNPDPASGNSGDAAMINGTLYTFRGRKAAAVETDGKQYQSVYLRNNKGSYIYGDIILKTDGTVLVNGEALLPEKCKEIRGEFMIGESGAFYGLIPQENGFRVFKPTSDAAYFVPGCDRLYVNNKGSLRYYTSLTTTGKISVGDTNIGEPVKSEGIGRQYYLLDKRGSLYSLDFEKSPFEKKLIAENIDDLRWRDGYILEYESKAGEVTELLKIVYGAVGGSGMHWGELNLDVDTFYIHEMQSDAVSENDAVISYFIDKNGELRFRFQDDTAGLTHVKCGLCATYDAETKSGLLWFLREDGSIWYYDLQEKAWHSATAASVEAADGDLNGDGVFSAADAVLLCRYLSGDVAAFPQWKRADLDANGMLNANDLTLMKRRLLNQKG